MNWLAHLHLSEPTPAFWVGNLLPDLLPRREWAHLPEEFGRGMEQHRRIDAFTDLHPIVRRSIQRIDPPFRRYGGILIDLFYDHFLSRNWTAYSETTLAAFTGRVYASFDVVRDRLPAGVNSGLDRMRAGDLLGSYREIRGIAHALTRIGLRLKRPVDLAGSIPLLERNYELLQADFHAFYPELQTTVGSPGACRPPDRC